MTTPADLYAAIPQRVTSDPWDMRLNGFYYQHVPEIDFAEIPPGANSKVEARILRHVDYDGRRYWRLATIWYDEKPVMVVQNAGREGDDHSARFVTDLCRYATMVAYLHSISVHDGPQIDPSQDRDDLLTFYGDSYILSPAGS